jgi:hypothetical protein
LQGVVGSLKHSFLIRADVDEFYREKTKLHEELGFSTSLMVVRAG